MEFGVRYLVVEEGCVVFYFVMYKTVVEFG